MSANFERERLEELRRANFEREWFDELRRANFDRERFDELSHDEQIAKRESYIDDQFRMKIDCYEEDHDYFLNDLNDNDKDDLLSDLVRINQNPEGHDYSQTYWDSQEVIQKKQRDTAELLAEELANGVGL